MLKAVIFDMDGVIINSEPLQFVVTKLVLKEAGAEITDAELSRYVGVANFTMWNELKSKYSLKDDVEELMNKQSRLRLSMLDAYDEGAIPGIMELLGDLKANNIPMAIASSSDKNFINGVLKKIKAESFFHIIVSGDQVKKSKPAPDIFLKAASLLSVEPEDCVVIEDSTNGVAAAVAAGMKCAGFKNIHSGNQDLLKADIIVDSIGVLNFSLLKSIA